MHRFEYHCGRCAAIGATETAFARPPAGPRPFALPGTPTRWSRDRSFDVRHIRIEVTLDPAQKRVSGTVTHTVRPFLSDLHKAVFDCQELNVSRVTVDGKRAAFEVEGDKLAVTLREPPTRGRDLKIAITYSGTPRRGLYFTGPDEHHPDKPLHIWTQGQDEDSRHWFPCFDYPNEKQTSEILCTVPDGLKVLSNGLLVKKRRDRKARTETWHWRLDHPHVAYLIMLAVGDFAIHETRWRDVPVTYWADADKLGDARRTLARTPQMMTLFSSTTGVRYPYAQYAQVFVQDFIFGGMENTSATTLTDTAILDRHARQEVYMDGLVAHELAHQWFGDLVTCRDWSQAWLNESFATFLESVWKRHAEGEDEGAYYRMADQSDYLAEDGGHYRRAIVCNTYNDPIEVFDRHLYQKGGCVLHMLERELGRDVFWESVNTYLRRHAGDSVVTDDLRRAVEDVSGRNLEWFFDQWVHHGGHPELAVGAEEEDGVLQLTVKQKQKTDAMTPLFRFRVGVRVKTDKEIVEQELDMRGAERTFHVPVKGKVRWIAFDPQAELLCTLELDQPEEAWTRLLDKEPDAASRVRAARTLAKKASPAATRALRRALERDDVWFVRVEAAKALGAIGGNAARDALTRNTKQEEPRVRKAVAVSLRNFRRDKKVARALTAMLSNDEQSPGVLWAAAASLGSTRCDGAYETLLKQLDRDCWGDMAKRGAIAGLQNLRDERARDTLIAATGKDRTNSVRSAAAEALRAIGRDDDEVREVLEDLVRDHWLRVQIIAAHSLADRRDEKSVGILRSQAERDLDGRVVRVCREMATKISTGRDRGDDLRKLRDELDALREQNRKLRDRVDKLESKVD